MNRLKIHRKIRKIVTGTADRPRLAVYRSLNNFFAQLIDDTTGKTLSAASSLKMTGPLGRKAAAVGSELAKKALAGKVTIVVFDRGGFPYQGNVKILAEAARQEGLKF